MPKTIEQYKQEILFRKRLKADPMSVFQNISEHTIPKETIKRIIKEEIEELLSDESIFDNIVSRIVNKLPELKDDYTPIKGKDYFDGESGKTPIKGKDYFDGESGKTPIKGKDYFTKEEVKKFKKDASPRKGVDYFDGSDADLDGKEIVNRINGLSITPDKQIDAKHIKGLEVSKIKKSGRYMLGGRGLHKIVGETPTITNSTTLTLLKTPATDFNGNPILDLFKGGIRLTLTTDWTISGKNITLVDALTQNEQDNVIFVANYETNGN